MSNIIGNITPDVTGNEKGIWLDIGHKVSFNSVKFPISKFDKMKQQYLHIYEFSKLFNDSVITNTQSGNMYRNGNLKIIDSSDSNKILYSTKMWSHYMSNREIINFFKAICTGNEEWDNLDANDMASKPQYDGDDFFGTIKGKYDSYSALKPFVRNIMNNDYFKFSDMAADIEQNGEILQLVVKIVDIKNKNMYSAPKIFDFTEDCLLNCTEL